MRTLATILLWAAIAPLPLTGEIKWSEAEPGYIGLDRAQLLKARDYALTGGGSGLVIKSGKRILHWGDQTKRYDLKSTSKSIGVTGLGLAIDDGKMTLSDLATKHHPGFADELPENKLSAWREKVTLFHLATQTAGFEKPGGYRKIFSEPGTAWHYSDCGPNWLAECVTLVYQQDASRLLFDRVFTPMGIEAKDLRWRDNQYRPKKIEGFVRREFGSGAHANVNAMARIGQLYLSEGKWRDKQLLSAKFIRMASRTPEEISTLPTKDPEHGNASQHYGLLWWNNNDGTLENVPRDAYWSWGLYDSLILVIPSLDLVVARAGKSWKRSDNANHYDVLKPFFESLVRSVENKPVTHIGWAPRSEIIRLARAVPAATPVCPLSGNPRPGLSNAVPWQDR